MENDGNILSFWAAFCENILWLYEQQLKKPPPPPPPPEDYDIAWLRMQQWSGISISKHAYF